MNNKGAQRRPEYILSDFLNDVKFHKQRVLLEPIVYEDAKNLLRLYGKEQILNYITEFPESKFEFVNCEPYRKGINGDHPLVDSYKLELEWFDVYIAFCFTKTINGWCIKSLHSDNGDTASIGSLIMKRLET